MTELQRKKYSKITHEQHQKETISWTVAWFAGEMCEELNKHTDRPGWKKEPIDYLLNRLSEELGELKVELGNKADKKTVIKECADVANFAMMIADVYDVV